MSKRSVSECIPELHTLRGILHLHADINTDEQVYRTIAVLDISSIHCYATCQTLGGFTYNERLYANAIYAIININRSFVPLSLPIMSFNHLANHPKPS